MAGKCSNPLDSMTITPAANGGHTIRHSFKARPTNHKGRMSGGLSMDYPEPEEHVFGADQSKQALAHIAKHLGIKGGAQQIADGADGEGQD